MSIYNPYGSYQPNAPQKPQKPRTQRKAVAPKQPPNQATKPYMVELNEWIDKEVLYPLLAQADDITPEDRERVIKHVMKMIREKVLESYRNGVNTQR